VVSGPESKSVLVSDGHICCPVCRAILILDLDISIVGGDLVIVVLKYILQKYILQKGGPWPSNEVRPGSSWTFRV
jgi:hypothetical protein